ncbi:MAG: 50S ribosomal protein L32 [Verrucomicrobia bacterium]|nr:50S ribosomal protein L32 [Verrucomicrobiota bacterium]MBU4290747.1 50S ribosomal protein L32 [Verrucomicrobiota bacterium]MBU4428680.1 50S ribosomal protein L32 [Verrucomicrobiota bacterium]MCG2679765.1 50S ribosomal protein L32 [Kiritimatiellia bacterium]
MAVPKRKTSKSRIRSRKRAHKITVPAAQPCPNCGQPHLPHRVCPACGYYKGRQVVTIKTE